jgi:hypothetical protein
MAIPVEIQAADPGADPDELLSFSASSSCFFAWPGAMKAG